MVPPPCVILSLSGPPLHIRPVSINLYGRELNDEGEDEVPSVAPPDGNGDTAALKKTEALSPPPSPPSSQLQRKKPNKRGYRFGDITRSLLGDRINQLTGKAETGQDYEFGDLTQWIDARVKDRVNQVTGKDNDGRGATYEFGDLTAWAWQHVENATRAYTGKEDYQVGDLSREVLRRVTTGEYNSQDVWLALRVLLSAGFSVVSPVASFLPIRVLLELVNVGLASEVSGRLLQVLAEALDRRVKQALTGKADYQIGDITKERLQNAIGGLTGKSTYEVGDISRAIYQLAQEQQQQQQQQQQSPPKRPSMQSSKAVVPVPSRQIKLDDTLLLPELEDWDDRFLRAEKAAKSSSA